MAGKVIDRAIQSYGAEGVSQDTPLAGMAAGMRTLRLADVRRFMIMQSTNKIESTIGPG
jgi:alkylation response protein AidB-like acyl-CoA dehydrogenase